MRRFNILTDPLPDTVRVFDTEFPVYTSFRNWIKISLLLADKSVRDSKKTAEVLKLCYKDQLPPNLVSAMLGMLQFLHRDTDISVSPSRKPPLFSLFQDRELIYAAFYRQYGIDLAKEDLHWYTFCALLASLPQDNALAAVMNLRGFDESTVKDPKRRRKIAALKKQFALEEEHAWEIDVAGQLETLF